ncbi:hypothetical protein [Paraburkholderia graminis]|uniref:hypothetical protein n=1 Tax=Paraburkholderia graminis TaxID=60548 RepID=UPI0038B6B528
MASFQKHIHGYIRSHPDTPTEAGTDAEVTKTDALRLYEALAENPLTVGRLAKRTATDPQRVSNWLAEQTARGHLQYDATSQRFWMHQEQARLIAEEPSCAFVSQAFAVWRSRRLLAR